MVDGVVQEAQISAAALTEVATERREFEAAWSAWLGQQYVNALATPLPRGWVPHADVPSGNTYFLNTRTGECTSCCFLRCSYVCVGVIRGYERVSASG
jgi:hypothetical protein